MTFSVPELASLAVVTLAASVAGVMGLSSVKSPCDCQCPAPVVLPSQSPLAPVISATPLDDAARIRDIEKVAGDLERQQRDLKRAVDAATTAAAERKK